MTCLNEPSVRSVLDILTIIKAFGEIASLMSYPQYFQKHDLALGSFWSYSFDDFQYPGAWSISVVFNIVFAIFYIAEFVGKVHKSVTRIDRIINGCEDDSLWETYHLSIDTSSSKIILSYGGNWERDRKRNAARVTKRTSARKGSHPRCFYCTVAADNLLCHLLFGACAWRQNVETVLSSERTLQFAYRDRKKNTILSTCTR